MGYKKVGRINVKDIFTNTENEHLRQHCNFITYLIGEWLWVFFVFLIYMIVY